MDQQFDIMENLDETLLDLLCQKNESPPAKESVVDQLCKKNEALAETMSILDRLCQTLEAQDHSVDSVPKENIE